MMVTCKLCNKDFKSVTNSHLRDKHNSTLSEYLNLFPDSEITSEDTKKARGVFSKGKTYEERYGEEVAKVLREQRTIDALRQYEDSEQRSIRRKYAWKGYMQIAGCYWNTVVKGAASRGYECTITIEEAWELYEKQNRKCALTGWPIEFNMEIGILAKYGTQKNTASLDRIDNTKGYITGNIQWLHKDINRLKSNWSQEYLIKMCKHIVDHISKTLI